MMVYSKSRAITEGQQRIAPGLLRGTLGVIWHAFRLPVFVFLVILEPVVRFTLGALALLGVLTGLFFKLYGLPHFPFLLMLGISAALGLVLAGYYAVLRLFAR